VAGYQVINMQHKKIPDGGALLIPFIKARFNENGEITDADTRNAIQAVLNALINVIEQSDTREA
jgi:hypothetical protein